MLIVFCLLFTSTASIVLSEDVKVEILADNSDQPIGNIQFPEVDSSKAIDDAEADSNKFSPRFSKDLKFVREGGRIESRSGGAPSDQYDMDEFKGYVPELLTDDEDYEDLGRSESIVPIRMQTNVKKQTQNDPKSVSDIPRIITLRDGFNLFRNFWRNRNASPATTLTTKTQHKDVLPVITLTTGPTGLDASQQLSDEFGTPTGTATGTGTITAASADEIAENNSASKETPETPSPMFSFGRRRNPIEFEIIEEDSDSNGGENIFAFDSDYIDISGDVGQPEDNGKSAISNLSGPAQTMGVQQQQQSNSATHTRKNAKQPVKVLTEVVAANPQIVVEAPKSGLDYYRQYLPNLRKLIEIRPKFFLNPMFSAAAPLQLDETSRQAPGSFLQRSGSKRQQQQQVRRRAEQPIRNIVGYVNADLPSKSNRLPVKRVQLYLV